MLNSEQSLSLPQSNSNATSLSEVLPPNVNAFVSDTLDNGLKVVSELSEGAKSTIDYLSGVATKMDGILTSLINELTGKYFRLKAPGHPS